MLKFIKIIALVTTIAALSACSKNEASEQKKADAPMEQMNKESSTAGVFYRYNGSSRWRDYCY